MNFSRLWVSTLCAIVFVTLAPIAFAQQMPPLAQLPKDTEQHHPYIRCAALYFTVASWFGSDRLGDEVFTSYRDAVGRLTQAAMVVRATQFPDDPVAENGQKTIEETRQFGQLYLDRMKRRFAENKDLVLDDVLIQGDLGECDFVAKFATQILAAQ